MNCYLSDNIENCLYILNDIHKFYIADYKNIEVNYDTEQEKILDIFTDLDWLEIKFNTISIQTDYNKSNKVYNTAIKITIDSLTNEINFYNYSSKKFVVLFIDKNDNVFADGVIENDNQYNLINVIGTFDNDNNNISFDLVKESYFNIKQIDNNYYNFNF